MENFKKFIQLIQTLNIIVIEGHEDQMSYLSLKHENPAYSMPYKANLKTITSLSSVELLGLDLTILKSQMLLLDNIKVVFDKFWRLYYSLPEPFSDLERSHLFYSLNLEDFIITGINVFESGFLIRQAFIDDLYDTIIAREEAINKLKLLLQSPEVNPKILESPIQKLKVIKRPLFISEDVSLKFLQIICSFFSVSDQDNLYELIINNKQPENALLFLANGNVLADTFKQLYMANLIVGCSKIELQRWVKSNFNYSDGGNVKMFSEKYLGDVISSNAKQCQSPILDVKVSSSGYNIVAITRSNKSDRGWG